MSYSKRQENFARRVPLYIGIFLLLAIYNPWTSPPPTPPNLLVYSEAELLKAQSMPKTRKYFAYISPAGTMYFGRVRKIENKIIELRLPDETIWCKLDEGLWIDHRRLPRR